jgi:stage III sporulation protein SpoIIIAA
MPELTTTQTFTANDDIALLLAILPQDLRDAAAKLPGTALMEIVMDLGRCAEARMPARAEPLSSRVVTRDDLTHALDRIGTFTADNRAGIERTLHRISAMRNRNGDVIGLTLRVGRAVFGTIDILRDLLESGRNLLILGRPGVGKTTLLREAARVLADDLVKRVIVVDTSNEIAGDSDIPHPAIGAARRMQVPHPEHQHAVMIEAVENHMPEVIVIDEIGSEAETFAARTIAERGVQLIGTAHGNTLENLVMNPTLSDLIGGVHQVTLSDEEAKRRGTYKTVSERRAPPTFDIVVEIVERDELLVHEDTADAVDRLLDGRDPGGERRVRRSDGAIERSGVDPQYPARADLDDGDATHITVAPSPVPTDEHAVRIYPYALSRELLERVIRDQRIHARAVVRPEFADMVIALRSRADDARLKRLLEQTGLPLHMVKSNSSAQLRKLLQNVFNIMHGIEDEEVRDAVREAEHAIQRVLNDRVAVALAPRRPTVRKLQHRMIARHQLVAQSEGSEPMRHLVIQPPG